MSVLVRIPTPLRSLTQGQAEVHEEGGSVRELLENLEKRYNGLKERLCDGPDIRRFINIYVNDEDIRFLQGTATPLKPGDQVSIVPAIAGGGLPWTVTRCRSDVLPRTLARKPANAHLDRTPLY